MSWTIRPAPFTSPASVVLIEAVQQEYVVRYGGRDDTPIDTTEFEPPQGLFLIAFMADQTPVGCGGWRRRPNTVIGEIKRMYVAPEARRLGVGRAVLAELERTAATTGINRLELETGSAQPEAVGLYAAAGYTPTARYGFYRDSPKARHLGKDLPVHPHQPVPC